MGNLRSQTDMARLLADTMDNISSHINVADLFRPTNFIILAMALYGAGIVRRLFKLRAALAGIGNLPGRRTFFGSYTLLGNVLPQIPYINLRAGWQLREKYRLHEQYGSDVISSAYLFDPNCVYLWIADANLAKEITTKRLDYPKPVKMFEPISIYGPNILASEFGEWKRQRRIADPSFGDRNNRLVHEKTTQLTTDLLNRWSADGRKVLNVENVVTFTSKLIVMISAGAGFGYRLGWDDTEEVPPGHKMTFRTALFTASNLRLLFTANTDPKFVTAFKELRVYMSEMIVTRRQSESGREDEPDLFTKLINSTSLDPKKGANEQLSDEELMGHETTAHSLGFTLALLATHQDIQEKAFQELRKVVPAGETPTYEQILKWSYGLAITHESLRMFPTFLTITRYAAYDAVLTTSSADGRDTPTTVPVPQGTNIMISIAGLHYNPKYWDKPEVFRPERFLGNYNRDAFMPWGAGPRSCIGRQISEIESVTFLANLILKYLFKVTPISGTETPTETKERVLRWQHGLITIAPEKVPLTFTLRNK